MNLAYPNDRDGGANRVAAIKQLERKLEMATRDANAKMIEKFSKELELAKDATKAYGPVPLV